MPADPAVAPRLARGRFYVWMAGLFVLIAFGLFAPTYWLQLPGRTFTGSPLLHMHGLLFSAWTLFFLAQTLHAAGGNVARHRAWGLFGIALATAMVFSGMATAIHAMTAGIAAGNGANAQSFAIVPVSAMALFAGFVAVAITRIRQPETHKRLMLLAMLAIIQAAIDRIFFWLNAGFAPGLRPGSLPTPPAEAALPSGLITIALILVAAVYDWRTRGKPHAAYVIGGGIVAATVLLRAPLSGTAGWTSFADFLARFAA